MVKVKTTSYSLIDFAMFQLVITLLALKDYNRLSLISQVLAIFLILINYIRTNGGKIWKMDLRYAGFKVVFLLFCIASTFWSDNPANYSFFLSLFLRIVTGLSVIIYISDEAHLIKIIKYIIIAAIILCVRMIFVVPLSAWGNERVGVYLSHNESNSYGYTGITYVLGFAISILMADTNAIKNKKLKYFLVIVFTFFSLMSGSKKQILFLIITIIMLTYYKSKNGVQLIKNAFISILIFIGILMLIFYNNSLYNAIGKRVASFLSYSVEDISVDTDASTLTRSYLLKSATSVFLENPIVGVGIDGFKYTNPNLMIWAENNFLELLADVGIIGFSIYYSLYSYIFVKTLKRIKYRNFKDIMIMIVLMCFIMVDFSMVSYSSSTLQFYLAFIFAVNKIADQNCKIVK